MFIEFIINSFLVSESGEDCPLETVTDTNMEVHPSLCSLVRTERKLSYFGDLSEPICRSTGIVCGINGVTYNSECEAMSGKILMQTCNHLTDY